MASTEPVPRRLWSDEEKRTILAEVKGGKTIGEVARHWQVNTSTIYYWRATADKQKRPSPGRIAAAAATQAKQTRLELAGAPPAVVAAPSAYIAAPKTHPRGLSYDELVSENARLWAALQAALTSHAR